MDKVEVGDYVRTAYGKIHKVVEIKESLDGTDNYIYYRFENNMGDFKSNIAKHSKNIIDLIDIGDILELKEGDSICYLGLKKDTITLSYEDIKEDIKNGKCELLSILTKEQYEENCYRLEEK